MIVQLCSSDQRDGTVVQRMTTFVVDETRIPTERGGRRKPYVVVRLQVSKVDAYWRKEDPFSYIYRGGAGGKDSKYADAMAWIRTQPVTWMPTLDGYETVEGFLWSDGRHRFSAWRDLGESTMEFVVPKDCELRLLNEFG